MNLSYEEWAKDKERCINNGPAVNNACLNSLQYFCNNPLWVKELAFQLYHIVLSFPFHISGAIASSQDEDLLAILVRNLYTEIGNNSEKAHIDIYRGFLKHLEVNIKRPELHELWPETINVEETCKTTYSNEDIGIKLGSLFAFECMSSPMVKKWHDALSQNEYPNPAFLFFTIHIDIEKEHVEDILKVSEKYWGTNDFNKSFDYGEALVIDALSKFWNKADEYYSNCCLEI